MTGLLVHERIPYKHAGLENFLIIFLWFQHLSSEEQHFRMYIVIGRSRIRNFAMQVWIKHFYSVYKQSAPFHLQSIITASITKTKSNVASDMLCRPLHRLLHLNSDIIFKSTRDSFSELHLN